MVNTYLQFSGSRGDMEAVSHHPPHLLDQHNHRMPSALIPFCAFGWNMSVLGELLEGEDTLHHPVCTKFRPTLLAGQLCYLLDLETVEGVSPSARGNQHGLTLFVDSYKLQGRSLAMNVDVGWNTLLTLMGAKQVNKDKLPFQEPTRDALLTNSEWKVIINTLEPFTINKAGTYSLSSVKLMEGTENFLDMDIDKRNCGKESHSDCMRRRFLSDLEDKCGCLPFGFTAARKHQVNVEF